MASRIGMRMGFAMRQQAIAAVFAKALRLNSSSIADISAGKVIHPLSAHEILGHLLDIRLDTLASTAILFWVSVNCLRFYSGTPSSYDVCQFRNAGKLGQATQRSICAALVA